MASDFLTPYLVTIAGVVTTGVAAFALRFVWRSATALHPTLLRLQLIEGGAKIFNHGDFTLFVLRVEAPPPPPDTWRYDYERPRRVAAGKSTEIRLSPDSRVTIRVDREYRVVVRDEHRARWNLVYAPDPALGSQPGLTPMEIERLWPVWVGILRQEP